MKHTFKYLLTSVALLIPVLLFSQTRRTDLPDPDIYAGYSIVEGIATAKNLGDPDANGIYRLTLETFTTGKASIEKGVPSDIILVLDVSGSMDDNMDVYTPREKQSYSYQSYPSYNGYYYRHTDGKYYRVSRGSQNNRYYLRFDTGTGNNHSYHYLSGETVTEVRPTNISSQTAAIWEGILYVQGSQKKMDALQDAVCDFIDKIKENDDKLRLGPDEIGNQISIIKFAGKSYDGTKEEGDDTYQDVYTYNYTQVVKKFTPVATGQAALKAAVNALIPRGATSVDYGMIKAKSLLDKLIEDNPDRVSNKTVVMFTDGEPTHNRDFQNDVAKDAVNNAKNIKDNGAVVFSVGVFDTETDDIKQYMEHVSSNYPDATASVSGNNISYSGTRVSDEEAIYYRNTGSGSLSDIFAAIADAASSPETLIGGETMLVDCVSNSFRIPSSVTLDQISIYTRTINTAGTAWGTAKTTLTKVPITLPDNIDFTSVPEPDPEADYMIDDTKVGVYLKDGKLVIFGFDYSKLDTKNNGVTTYGNWVGFRDVNDCHGKELVIEFDVEADPMATGGDGTNSNTSDSGIYTLQDDGSYKLVNAYSLPHKDLPINLVIEKSGLRAGESATIQIYRCAQKKDENNKVVYNPKTGKPMPEKAIPAVGTDPNDVGWENFSKVILTNTTGVDGRAVSKTLLSLHSEYVYLLVEDNWGWAYELDDSIFNTSDVEKNPFRFINIENVNAVKRAESISINHFGSNSRSDTYKSSKANYFTYPVQSNTTTDTE